MNKIKEEQLKKIQEQQTELNKVINQIGYLEGQKHAHLHQMADINHTINEFKLELEKEYGQVNINVETGEYSKIEEKPAELKTV